ncbi:hypothetical protein [Streptomyces griseomycini]|uniref:MarR family transcriptional regulator n=1 Tax=Streptomyces griseomycini TaxID=66895 RepID=A0A7W7PWK4_9ACTN|nr:hypothetical protein [Streptomyces griseomycini]MBB4902619.1 hypothetical protein [Streptomyces griseomycini]GGR54512.1 hypothetical protein GCM10015536_69890 [Streptomyces griseomycini]
MTSHALAPVPTSGIDAALMRFPYEQWIPMPAAAAHIQDLGLSRESLTTVVRLGRRRGVLRTRKDPELRLTYVQRIHDAPYRDTT